MRRWQAENLAEATNVIHEQDYGKNGHVSNSLTRPIEGDEIREIDDGHLPEEPPHALFEADDLASFGSERSFLMRGDLVELRSVLGYAVLSSESS